MRFLKSICAATVVFSTLCYSLPNQSEARSLTSADRAVAGNGRAVSSAPEYCAATHDVGRIALGVTNHGVSGKGLIVGSTLDCFTGTAVPGCVYPKGSTIDYLFGSSVWVGAVVGDDTLVSTGNEGWQLCREMNPNQATPNHMIYRSIYGPDSANAVSEEDYVSVYTDTFTSGVTDLCTDFLDGRAHQPLPIEVTERSFAWSADEVSKVIFVELGIRNIGSTTLNDAYVGLLVDADVGSVTGQPFIDDLTGLVGFSQDSNQCGAVGNELLVACIGDNDGDLSTAYPAPGVFGLSFLYAPVASPNISYHWWQSNASAALDYGPRRRDLIRDFGTGGTGTPEGDRNKYFLMSSGELDFAQIYTATIEPTDPDWDYPNQTIAAAVSRGNDSRFLFSVGSFTIEPQQELPLVYAWMIGDSVHKDAGNLQNLPNDPDKYYANLDFSDLERTVRAANRFYDNPGVDTDVDGYRGEFTVCCVESVLIAPSVYQCTLEDTVWIAGDGIPDYAPYTPSCCEGRTGNVNMTDIVDLSDLAGLISYLVGGGYVLPCWDEANVNGTDIVDLSDLAGLISYLVGGGYVLPACP